jgi:hypothetical protein
MNRINCYAFYSLGKLVGRLVSLKPETPHLDIFIASLRTNEALHRLFSSNLPLRNTEEASKGLSDGLLALNSVIEKEEEEKKPASRLSIDLIFNGISKSVGILENVMSVELARAPIYAVPVRGVFSTDSLLDSADDVFEDARNKVPDDARADTRQAGRCLAFDLPTAAGFHVARATESVMKKTMGAFGCPLPKESQRNWGFYINALEEHGVRKELTHHLSQLKDLHRNPLIHPEITLTPLEAQQLWSLCTSAIMVMIAEIDSRTVAV